MTDEVSGGVVKVIEVVGSSPESFDDAVRRTVGHVSETVRGIRGLEVLSQTVEVDGDALVNFKVHCKVAFVVESSTSGHDGRTAARTTAPGVESEGVVLLDPQDEVGAAIRRSTVG